MRSFISYLRVIVIVALVAAAAEYFIDSGDQPAFLTYPEVPIFIGLFTIGLIGLEVIVGTMQAITNAIMTEERKKELAEQKALARENAWYRKLYTKLLDQKPIEEEGEIILTHDYDGIKELDNNLPPWWIGLFYVTIVIGFIYMARFHIFGADLQAAEYEKDVAEAQIAIEKYKLTAKDLVDENTVTLLTEATDLTKGQNIFNANCVACHAPDGGGGIGPNLTDNHWILGGGIKNVFHTISEGGRDGKGMVAWKQTLKPSERQQVASYVISLYGTTPANPKEPQGDIIWAPEGADKAAEATSEETSETNTETETMEADAAAMN
ncbi:cytochrome c oxidase cbb3-type subunit 3 [Pustulibacterium marinum]|uniref:Cytochrome c oxidase cbb3-type subunit 3 n=1 Tax=Pustulibacterium marinum TaxID=1224947 RepID=A0A1I7FB62_9FLAO|nr:cbb3-type cytochrome c oxidase N-terminal domain-containing protein [Pustulibacterium marinum]SFU33355.1 cytochrome c oxidase cbb3-type subunit 3 [Pustulibacterium marinum]